MAEETMKDFEAEIDASFRNPNEGNDDPAWIELEEALKNKTVMNVKVGGIVNGGLIAYINELRAFIPASQISIQYVKDLNEWLGKKLDVIVITAERENNRLVLSGKAVEQMKRDADKKAAFDSIEVGSVVTGKVENLTTYGAFVDLGNNISGLLHISQMSLKRIAKPSEVVKEGQEVTVKVIKKEDGKISLSMKVLQQDKQAAEEEEAKSSYQSGGDVSTSLGSLLAGIKLD
ncbi:S1 RNA-binding domain-containing protein [Eubacterium oxidoreducens]|uniref:Small subunit ribosomal protein S1 n=1 Tax=Eubacterium oxidoreducens TaxID=1732 RepID=A0A1G6BGJ9_EUBOX|nr:S1 RNA-binding domain-containing protein [Eubacterium oxidoreducens]SDB19699.1 small subunit ribosomal protein S1 [Eubacterium oxidoreducens]